MSECSFTRSERSERVLSRSERVLIYYKTFRVSALVFGGIVVYLLSVH